MGGQRVSYHPDQTGPGGPEKGLPTGPGDSQGGGRRYQDPGGPQSGLQRERGAEDDSSAGGKRRGDLRAARRLGRSGRTGPGQCRHLDSCHAPRVHVQHSGCKGPGRPQSGQLVQLENRPPRRTDQGPHYPGPSRTAQHSLRGDVVGGAERQHICLNAVRRHPEGPALCLRGQRRV